MSADIDRRLQNWGRAMRTYCAPKHCGSVEWHYIQHRTLTEGEEQTRRTPQARLDLADAQLVELAWRKLADDQHKKLLVQRYVWFSRDERICQRLGIPTTRINGYLIYLQIALRSATDAIRRRLDDSDYLPDDRVRQVVETADRRKTDAVVQASAPLVASAVVIAAG